MKIIGLTGMSGAGKTTVCEVFRKGGVQIVNCDLIARQVVAKGEPCLKEIADKFSAEFITKEGELDRKKMGALVFSDSEKRKLLNDTIYPHITNKVKCILNEAEQNGQQYILLDAPTLFESGIDNICSVIVSVVAERSHSIERIMARDRLDRKQAEQRLNSQFDKDFYKAKSDFCIENDGNLQELTEKAEQILFNIKHRQKEDL